MSTTLANPAKMIAKGAPHIIHNDQELEAYTEALFKLTALENPSPSETEAIELLSLLVERYEDEHWPITEVDPISVVRYLIEKGNLRRPSLVPEFGSESSVQRARSVCFSPGNGVSPSIRCKNSVPASNHRLMCSSPVSWRQDWGATEG